MDFDAVTADTPDFDPQTYVRILIAIAKADKDNGTPEYRYVRQKAQALAMDFDHFWEATEKDFKIEKLAVSRLTALTILKDTIVLASMDRNFSLPERQRVYAYAEKLDIPRKDVDELEKLVDAYRRLNQQWRSLVAGR